MPRLSRARIDQAVNSFAKEVVKEARGNLSRKKMNANRKLWSSIGYKFKDDKLTFHMAAYGVYQDQGVTGTGRGNYKPTNPRRVAQSLSGFSFKKGPVGPDADRSFREWIRARNIQVRDKKGRFVKLSTASFLIRRSTGRFGIEPKKFFTDAIEKGMDKFDKELGPAITASVNEALDNILKNNDLKSN